MRVHPRPSSLLATWLLIAAVGACRPADVPPLLVDVIGSDYAFTVRDTVNAGHTLLSFASRGAVRHEMVLGRIREATPTAEFVDSLMRGHSVRKLRVTGTAVLFAAPGQAGNPVRLSVTFQRGQRYALWCQFRDSATAPKHHALGMFKILTVK